MPLHTMGKTNERSKQVKLGKQPEQNKRLIQIVSLPWTLCSASVGTGGSGNIQRGSNLGGLPQPRCVTCTPCYVHRSSGHRDQTNERSKTKRVANTAMPPLRQTPRLMHNVSTYNFTTLSSASVQRIPMMETSVESVSRHESNVQT